MTRRGPRFSEGATQDQDNRNAWGSEKIVQLRPDRQQPSTPLRVSDDFARLSWLTRRPIDRLRVGRHRRRMAASRLREVAA